MLFNIKNILSFSLLAVTLVGCGGSKAPASRSPANIQPFEAGPITPAQRAIATRICYAYQSKASAFRTTPFMGKTFNFNIRQTNCSNEVKEYSLTPVLRYNLDNALEFYIQDNINLLASNVQTDTTGFLSQLCTKIKNNQPISNTFVVNNVQVQVEFFRDDLDSYTLRTFINKKDKTLLESADTFKARTQFNISGNQILGMDEVFTRQKLRPGEPNQTALPAYSQFVRTFDSISTF